MREKYSKIWISMFFVLTLLPLIAIVLIVVYIDPFFHYHKPHTEKYFYYLNNQRSQNNGILKNFDYDAIITGTSMTENFKTSELDSLFEVNSVKVPYEGGLYKEINDNLEVALKSNQNVKRVVRCLDTDRLEFDKDRERTDLGSYPTYLYDSNPFNDVEYIFNRDVLFDRIYVMNQEKKLDIFIPGITSFDDYSRWQYFSIFGKTEVLSKENLDDKTHEEIHLSEEKN